jgi:DNA modification methylase
MIPLNKINTRETIQNRRYSKEEWEEFKASILKTGGIISPIALGEYNEPFNGYTHYLLAGRHRYLATKELGFPEIPARLFLDAEDFGADEMMEIEAWENLQRKDLAWNEQLKYLKDLHERWTKVEMLAGNEWSMTKSAARLGVNTSTVSRDLELAHLLSGDDEITQKIVEKAATKKDARRLLKTVEKKMVADQKLEAFKEETEEEHSTLPLKQVIASKYNVGDGLEWLAKRKNERYDLIEFDPDYPIDITEDSLTHKKAITDQGEGDYHRLSPEEYKVFLTKVFAVAYNKLQENGWFIVWFGFEYFQFVQDAAKAVGFRVDYKPGIWLKLGGANTQNPESFLGQQIEPFFYFRKGTPKLNKAHSQVFMHNKDHSSKKINAYQKPVALYQDILETFLTPGSKVASPCLGSGNILLAAANLQMGAEGCDMSEEQQKQFTVKCLEGEIGLYK